MSPEPDAAPPGPDAPGSHAAGSHAPDPVGSDAPDAAGTGRERQPLLPWWHELTPTTRKAVRAGVVLLVTLVIAAGYGVLTASTRSSLGPHEADYSVTLSGDVAIDLGPLGSVILESPVRPLGVDVVVHEIPAELTAVAANPVTGLAGDLAAYVQFFSAPDAAISSAVDGLVGDALGRTVIAWSALLLLIAAARFASRGLLRTEVAQALRRPGVAALVVVLVVGLGMATAVDLAGDERAPGQRVEAFADTPLEEVRITGRLGSLVDTYGSYVVEAYRENEEFYAQVQDNLAAAYEDDPAPRAPDPSATPLAVATGDATPSATAGPETPSETPAGSPSATEGASGTPSATVGASGTPAGSPSGTPTEGASETPSEPEVEPEPVTFVVVSDLHCNVGMAPVVGALVDLAGADALLDAGDTVMSGTSVESYCVNAFAQALPDGVQAVVAPGNHDSVQTAEQFRDAGYTVLDGRVVDVAGVRILGDTDPTLTAVGSGTQPEREETVPEMGLRLAATACEAADDGDTIDLLLVHNPRAAMPALEEGCAPLALSGHWHRREGPEPYGRGVRYVSSSSAGAVSGGATIGPLNGEAALTVLRVDAVTGRAMDYRLVTVAPDASVSLGPWTALPEAEAEVEAEAADGGSGDGGSGDGGGGSGAESPAATPSEG
ncbi:metallophosphoesterase family protein [Georgenia faecalis]|uniref:Metallophosphoesterase n=1 Tax=Georgenia faecalis TaxID=2483799 RepID=A0ABV9D9T0_9MICO|nr:metallophosphoesterase [Georgenia faecalis]